MSLKGVNIQKGPIGPNVAGPGTAVSGFIANGVGTPDLDLGKSYKLLRLSDAEGLGINAEYDDENEVNVYRHIAEFYRMAGDGVPLWIMIVAQNVTMEEMLGIDDDAVFAQRMIIDAAGEIRQIAVAFNPADDYVDANTDGVNNDAYSAILVAQAWYQWTYDTFRPCHVLIEGRAMNGSAVACLDLRAIDNDGEPYDFNKVSLVIGQDYDYAEALSWDLGKKFADVGNVLGILSLINMNQNIGEVESLNISDAVRNKYKSAGISSHVKVEDIESQWETFDDKGYILPVKYTGISGYRWNNDHVCAPIIIDEEGNMNEHYISLGRAVNEVVRSLRITLLPEVKKTHPVDEETGKLPHVVIKYFEGIGNETIKEYKAGRFITGGDTTVDPDSDLLGGEKALNVSFEIVPTGTVGLIKGQINLKTSL